MRIKCGTHTFDVVQWSQFSDELHNVKLDFINMLLVRDRFRGRSGGDVVEIKFHSHICFLTSFHFGPAGPIF